MEIDTAIYEACFDVNKVKEKCPHLEIDDIIKRINTIQEYKKKLDELLKIPKIEQKSTEWYEARHSVISASDLAQALGEGKFGTQRDLIIKKVQPPEYGILNNPFFAHGNLFEPVANAVYSAMHKVYVHEFGLLKHPHVSYAAASPDGITEHGIMLEIKCPLKRKIVPGADVPTQYYYQIQGQLDVCDLDECDYFECEFVLCKSVWEFEASKLTKGVFAKDNCGNVEYGPVVLEGENVSELQKFVTNALEKESKIQYWILKTYNLKRVYRDKEFIKQKYAELKEVWDMVVHYRENLEAYKKEILCEMEIETEPANLGPSEPTVPKLPRFAFIETEFDTL